MQVATKAFNLKNISFFKYDKRQKIANGGFLNSFFCFQLSWYFINLSYKHHFERLISEFLELKGFTYYLQMKKVCKCSQKTFLKKYSQIWFSKIMNSTNIAIRNISVKRNIEDEIKSNCLSHLLFPKKLKNC